MAVGHLQRIASTYPGALVQVHRQRCQSSEGCGLAFLEPHLTAVGHLQRIASTYPGALVQVHGQRCQSSEGFGLAFPEPHLLAAGAASRVFEFSAEALLGVVKAALESGQAGPLILGRCLCARREHIPCSGLMKWCTKEVANTEAETALAKLPQKEAVCNGFSSFR